MKKITFLLVAFMATMFCACSSDDDNESSNVLEGTTWESTEEWDGTVYAKWVLKFQKSTFNLDFSNDSDGDGVMDEHDSTSGSYKVDGNKVSVSGKGLTMTGTISGNTIHFTETDNNDEFEFYKK